MCGICGIVHCDARQPVDRELLMALNAALVHRGPDGVGYHIQSGAGLAARCLLVDEHTGQTNSQPASNELGTVWAALDGAIYNAADLRQRLHYQGHQFASQSNAELLAHLYEEVGEDLAAHLVGEFVFAVWDAVKRRMVLARDRLGVKPLYLTRVDGAILFASELRALLRHPHTSRTIDLHGLSEYLTFQHTLPPRTILAGVQKLPAGHQVLILGGTVVRRQYWDLYFPPEADKEQDVKLHVRRFRDAFATAVCRRLPTGEPVGAFLSGGMDSSSVVAMARYLGVRDLHTYSGGYMGAADASELNRARRVAEHLRTEHYELAFSAEGYAAALPRFIAYMDDPVADEASLIRMLLAERARQDVRVVLGGEGGDDVAAGYSFAIFQERFDRLRRFQRIPYWLRGTVPALLGPVLPGTLRAWLARGNRDLATINADEHYVMAWAFDTDDKRRCCPPLREIDDTCHERVAALYAASGTDDPLSQALYVMTKIWAAENLMMSADKMTMSHSVQFRAPFLDHELVEQCAAIPSAHKVRREPDGSYTIKAVMKDAMRGMLPDAIMNLPKSPFQVPAGDWFRDALAGACRDVLLSEPARASGLYDPAALTALFEQHAHTPRADSMMQIRNLLFFELWRQRVLEGVRVPDAGARRMTWGHRLPQNRSTPTDR